MKKAIYILILITSICGLFFSCKTQSNFNKIAEYFKQTKDTTFYFIRQSKISAYIDTVKYTEKIEMHNKSFKYSLIRNNPIEVMDIQCNSYKFCVTKDSGIFYSFCERKKYKRKTKDIFTFPEYGPVKGMYREYNDTNNLSVLRLELRWTYPYRMYFTFNNEDLILHKEYNFKGDWTEEYYYSLKNGLYKITILGGILCEQTKINNK